MYKLFEKEEVDDLKTYFSDPSNPYNNMHSRITRVVKKKAGLLGLVGVKDLDGEVVGSICGPIGELDFVIMDDGNVDVTYSTYETVEEDLKVLGRIRTALKRRTSEGFPGKYFTPKLTPGEFYLRRSGEPTVTASAKAAIEEDQLSERFVDKMVEYNLKVIRGRSLK